jgi:hypothetical protein
MVGFDDVAGFSDGKLVGRALGAPVGDFVASSEMVGLKVKVDAGERVGAIVGACEEKAVGVRVASRLVVGLYVKTVGSQVGAEVEVTVGTSVVRGGTAAVGW